MTGAEARALRLSTGLDYKAWAALLGIVPKSVVNVECGNRQAGQVLEMAWRRLAQQKKARKVKTTP